MATKTLRRRTRSKLDIRAAVRSWLLKDDGVKALSVQKEAERLLILEYLQENGTQDENGHFWINWPEDPVEGRVKGIKAEKRVSKVLDPERTEEYLKSRKLYSKCTETVTILSEEKILGLAFGPNAVIPEADLEKLYDVTETYAFVPQRVKL